MQCSVKLAAASARRRIDCSIASAITGLKTLSSRWPWLPAKVTAAWLPKTRTQTMVMASACVGLTLPGMIEEPGSFSGRISSPMPARGPEPSRRMSLAILNRLAASVLRAPWRPTMASCVASASNLFVGRAEGQAGQLRELRGDRLGEAGMGVEPGPDGRAALGERHQLVEPARARAGCRARPARHSRRIPGRA